MATATTARELLIPAYSMQTYSENSYFEVSEANLCLNQRHSADGFKVATGRARARSWELGRNDNQSEICHTNCMKFHDVYAPVGSAIKLVR